jgi:hypothetical protein
MRPVALDRAQPGADHPMRSVAPDRREDAVRAPRREYLARSDAEFPADRTHRPPPRPDAYRPEASWSSPLADTTSQLPVADARPATRDDRPDYLGRTSPSSPPAGSKPRPQIDADPGGEPGAELRRPARGDLGRGYEPRPSDPGRVAHDDLAGGSGYRRDSERRWSVLDDRLPRGERTERRDPGRPADDSHPVRDGYRPGGPGLPAGAGESGSDGPRARSGRDALRAEFDLGRGTIGERGDGRGPGPGRAGFGLEPRGDRPDGRGPARERAGLGLESRGDRDDGRGPGPERAGFGVEPRGYRDDARGPGPDRAGLGLEPRGYRDDGREPGSARARFGLEPSSYRDDGRPVSDRHVPDRAVPDRPVPDRAMPDRAMPDRAGFELGPDAYRDDGRGAASDRHGLRPERAGLEPGGTGRDLGHAYDHPDPLERPRSMQGDSWPRRAGLSERPADLHGLDGASRRPEGLGPVPVNRSISEEASGGDDDDTVTRPLPVILPGATSVPRPGPVEAPRGPFEPARASQPSVRPASVTGSVEPPPATFSAASPSAEPPTQAAPRPMLEAAAAKLDQIKDLYLTAEAIGEDALDKHFDQVSQRQRELISEFFERSKRNGSAPSTDPAQE